VATMRREIWIDRSADDVWSVVGDPLAVTRWFPGTTAVELEGDQRTITLASGLPLIARIAVHPELRRFQYRLLGALPVDEHLTSIDVIPVPVPGNHDDGSGAGNGGAGARCLVVYSTDVVPHALAPIIDGAVGEALTTLRGLMEQTDKEVV
jgi:hypothetical protein